MQNLPTLNVQDKCSHKRIHSISTKDDNAQYITWTLHKT